MRVIRYEYNTFLLGCECCSDSESFYEQYEDFKLIDSDSLCCCANEQELREYLAHLEPFEVDPDSRWF